MSGSVSEILQELVRKHQLAVDGLTEAQLAEAIRQACACGDFQRFVRVDNGGQQVVYIPFAREQELMSRIANLCQAYQDATSTEEL